MRRKNLVEMTFISGMKDIEAEKLGRDDLHEWDEGH